MGMKGGTGFGMLEAVTEQTEQDFALLERRLARKLNWGDSVTGSIGRTLKKKGLEALEITSYEIGNLPSGETITGEIIPGCLTYNLLRTVQTERTREYVINSDLGREYHQVQITWSKQE